MRVLGKLIAGITALLVLGSCQTTPERPQEVTEAFIDFITTHCISRNIRTGGHRNKIKARGYVSSARSVGNGWISLGFSTDRMADYVYINPISERGVCGRAQWTSTSRQEFRIDKTRLTNGLGPIKKYLREIDPEAVKEVMDTGGTYDVRKKNDQAVLRFVGDKKLYTDRMEDVGQVALDALTAGGDVDTPVSLNSVPWFQTRKLGDFMRSSEHRALAVGYPSHCIAYSQVSNSESRITAAKTALKSCLRQYVSAQSPDQPIDCNCRLALLDDELFVDPESFTADSRTGISVNVTEDGGDKVSLNGVGFWKNMRCGAWGQLVITSLDEQKNLCRAGAIMDCSNKTIKVQGQCFDDGTLLKAALKMGKNQYISYGTGEMELVGVGKGQVEYGPHLLP